MLEVEEDIRGGEELGTGMQGLCVCYPAGGGGRRWWGWRHQDFPWATHQLGAGAGLCLPGGSPRRNPEDHIPKGDAL